jgi:sulfite reductase (ferredoxin)
MGTGECAGEVVSRIDFDLQEAERRAFEAQLLLEKGDFKAADESAFAAMVEAARGLVRLRVPDVSSDVDVVVAEFRTHLLEPQVFWDKYAGAKFAQYFLQRYEDTARAYSQEASHHLIEEAQLFIEAAHACHMRIVESAAAARRAIAE